MARRRETKYVYIVVLVFLSSLVYNIVLYRSNTILTANIKKAQNARAKIYHHGTFFNVTNEKLEFHGNFLHGRNSETKTLIIGDPGMFKNDVYPVIRRSYKSENYTLNKQQYFNHDMRVKNINCLAIINGDMNETATADELDKTKPKVPSSAESYINWTSNCSNFINDRGYIMDPLTERERHFSVAFSILMYKDIEQTERLLRAIYRPQHFFCIHVDSKTNEAIYKAMLNIAGCFENVFLLQKRYNVKWGTMTVLNADLSCMEALWNRSKKWKYFINLTGQEFPLRTNSELVQILQAYNGANDVGVADKSEPQKWRKSGTPPHGIIAKKGSVHITASRGFVDFVLHDQRALDFLNWTKKTRVPDETFFSSMNHNPSLEVPGSYRGLTQTGKQENSKPFIARFKNWRKWPCSGERVRKICIFGIGDLPQLAARGELFANKFHLNYQHYALDCMEELHYNRTRDEYLGKLEFDAQLYSQLVFVANKID